MRLKKVEIILDCLLIKQIRRYPGTGLNLEERIKNLFLILSPYEIKNGIRFIRGTNKLVSESLKIICIDTKLSGARGVNNKIKFSSI